MSIQLTAHFSLDELTMTNNKKLREKNYQYGLTKLTQMNILAHFCEQVRLIVGCPMTITSGIRVEELNTAVGGSKTSQHCFDVETEILTNNGWKKWNTISKQDKCYSYNLQKKQIEITDIQEIVIRDYKGKMYCAETKDIDYCATDEHRFLVKTNKYKRKTDRKMSGEYHKNLTKAEWQFKLAKDIHNHRNIHLVSGISSSKKEFNIDLLKLSMAVICDGYTYKKKNCKNYFFGFNLAKERKIERVKYLLEKCNIKYTLREDKSKSRLQKKGLPVFSFYINSTQAKAIIDLIGAKKEIPEFILGLKADILKQLVYEYSFFDGNIYSNLKKHPNEKNFTITTINKRNADILQQMCLLSGLKATIQKKEIKKGFKSKNDFVYIIQIVIKKESKVSESSCSIIDYNNKVWCIRNINETIIIRRNGKILITGNCKGEAIDFIPTKIKIKTAFDKIRNSNLEFGQLIIEKSGNKEWLHISIGFKKQVLKYIDGKYTAYEKH